MMKYREKAEKATPNANDEEPPILAVSPKVEAYMTLAAEYGLEDNMTIGDPGKYQQTLEEEYQAYVTAPSLPRGTDPLRFWEACGDTNGA